MRNLRNIVDNPELPGQPALLLNHGLGYYTTDGFHRLYFAYESFGQKVKGTLVSLTEEELNNFIAYYHRYLTMIAHYGLIQKETGKQENALVLTPPTPNFTKIENSRSYDPLFDNTYLP